MAPHIARSGSLGLVLLLVPPASRAEDCIDYASRTHWLSWVSDPSSWGIVEDVVVRPPLAFASVRTAADEGSILAVVSYRDPQKPRILGRTAAGAGPIALAGEHVYVASTSLQIADVLIPESPRLVGATGPLGITTDVAVRGRWAYVAASGAVRVVDVSDPAAPIPTGVVVTAGPANAMTISDDHLYVAVGGAGVEIFDLADPRAPAPTGLADTPGIARRVAVDGPLAYVADGAAGLQIVDVADPHAPALLGRVPDEPPYQVTDVAVAGRYAYVPWRWIVDVSDPSAPRIVRPFGESGGPGIAVSGNAAWMPASLGIYMVRLADPAPTVGEAVALPMLSDVEVRGTVAYATSPSGSGIALYVLDVSDSENVSVLGGLATTARYRRFDLAGNYAYVGHLQGMDVVDVARPERPAIVGSFASAQVRDVVVAGNVAYLIEHSDLRVVDVSDPRVPVILGELAMPASEFHHIALAGDYLYAATTQNGVRIVHVADPRAPRLVTTVPSRFTQGSVAVSGPHLLFGNLTVADISDPEHPRILDRIVLRSAVHDIEVVGRIAYCMGASTSIHLVDFSNPRRIRIVGGMDGPGRYEEIHAADGRLWIASSGMDPWRAGLYMAPLHCARPDDPPFAAREPASWSFPNPFRDGTRVSFEAAAGEAAAFGVYDVAGRRVFERVLPAGAAGTRTVEWDGHDSAGRPVPAGVYFYDVRAGDARRSGTVTILR